VMDEPTNDLDVETLELLEELLIDYPGTLILVSHDRDFLDNVVTSSLVMEGNGRVGDYVGGYTDWLRQRRAPPPAAGAPRLTPQVPKQAPAATPPAAAPAKRKLGFKEQRELEQLPALIESLEGEVAGLAARIASPELYREGNAQVLATNQALAAAQARLEAAYARWGELDG
jgi:ATP-binding cassette subfamily F protein uup